MSETSPTCTMDAKFREPPALDLNIDMSPLCPVADEQELYKGSPVEGGNVTRSGTPPWDPRPTQPPRPQR
ncbi:uncharacterized protein PG986_013958 [Apiospora aurea]|uniref:Uncharacterized protein n=1 Tax=Apiospora aurea TaxID=335848 RepID=A0ABR1PXL5_9PEZI